MSRRILLLLLGLAALVLASSVGAAARPVGTAQADLSTNDGVAAYLSSKGLNATGFVVQRGRLNYAGPKCPGRKWKCTKNTKVVQVASGKHGRNQVDCDGSLTQTTNAVTCIVVQNAMSGKNKARCSLAARDVSPVVLTCQITQTNTDGDNIARVRERVAQRDGASQLATLNAQVTQTNGTGDNESDVNQRINQRSDEVSMATVPTQNQEARFTGRIAQTSDSGINDSRLIQNLAQSGKASGGTNIVQRQFNDAVGDVDQTIGDVGPSATGSSKSKNRKSKKSKSFSKSFARQVEHQRLKGPGQQIQIGPVSCCSTQLGGDQERTQARIRQRSHQEASQPTAQQSIQLDGTCTTVGDCGIRHRAQNNEDLIRVLQRCVAPEGGTCSLFVPTTCGSEGCSSGGDGEGSASVTKRRR